MKTQSTFLVCLFLFIACLLPASLVAQEKKNDIRLQTKLILAIRKNSLPDVKQAIAEGADAAGYGYQINGEIPENLRPLEEAASYGNVTIARFLVAKGAPLDGSDIYGNTPLMAACQADRVPMAKWLLQHGARVDAQGIGGTALFDACSYGHVDVAQLLLRYKAAVNFRDTFQRRTPLFYAAGQGYLDLVKLLLKNGADINAKNKKGETALTWAKEAKKSDIVALLIAAGATE